MKSNKSLWLLVILGLFLNSYAINWGLPNVNDWTNLSLAPLKPLSYAKHLLGQEPWAYHYPPFHFILLAVAYSPYVLFLVMTGGMSSPSDVYPYGLANPQLSLTVFTLIARFVSVAMGVGAVIVNYYAVKKFYDRKAAFVVGFLIATSYPIIHYSHNANVDVPQLFWLSLCLYSFISLYHEPKAKYYMMLGVFAAFAFTTKESIYGIYIGMAVVIGWLHFIGGYKSGGGLVDGLRNVVDRRILYGLIIFGLVTLVIFSPILNWDGFIFHIDRHSLRSIRGNWVIRDAPNKIQGHMELIYHYVTYMMQSNGPLVFLLLIGGFIYCCWKSPSRSLILILPMVSYYTFFLRIHGTHHLRYMLPIYLLLFWFAGKLSSVLLSSGRTVRGIAVVFIGLVLIHSLLYGASVNMLYGNDARYEAERWINENIPAGAVVIGVEPNYSLPRLPANLSVVKRELWNFNGELINDINDIDGDYVVLGMSIPRRRERKDDIERFFDERGYQEIASFRGPFPVLAQEIRNLHVINPRITILKKSRD